MVECSHGKRETLGSSPGRATFFFRPCDIWWLVWGKQKLADIWDKYPYIVKSQPVPGIPVYEVQQENSRAKSKLLHRNMLLRFNGLPVPAVPKPPKATRRPVIISDDSYQADSSSSSTEDSPESIERQVPRYVIPQRRGQKAKSSIDASSCGLVMENSRARSDRDQQALSASPYGSYSRQSSCSLSSTSSSPVNKPRRGLR